MIVGSGPAGLTAAIYNVRADLKTVVVGGGMPGGQLTITTLVENWPGHANGIGGPKLMMDMLAQVKNLGGKIKTDEVVEVKKNEVGFEVKLQSGEVLQTRAVIVATGAKSRWLQLPNEKELIGKGVSGCATCDAPFFRNKIVAVVGGGDTAVQEAVFLSKFASKVYLIHRRDELRATETEQKRLKESPVEVIWNTEVKEIIGSEKLEKIRVVNNKSQEEKVMEIDGLFVAIGHQPATSFLGDLVELKEAGHIKTDLNDKYPTMTSCPGIFAAGDCADETYRQAVVAAGTGSKAALDAERWLEEDD